MVDEMDLLGALKGARPLRPQAYEEARTVLRTAVTVEAELAGEEAGVTGLPVPPTVAVPQQRNWWNRRRTVGLGAAVLAGAAAVTLAVTSVAGFSQPDRAGQPGAAVGGTSTVLTQLAAQITATGQAKLSGDATLEIRNHVAGSSQVGDNGLDLYSDDGAYYWGPNAKQLQQAVAGKQQTGEGAFQRDIAVALFAVKGDLATARARMAVAAFPPGAKNDTSPQTRQVAIEKQKLYDKEHGIPYSPPKPPTAAQQKESTDNYIFINATDALTAAPENTQVRAGVLRLLASLPNVKVTHTTTAGQATLTVSDTWSMPGGKLTESLVVGDRTGFPVADFVTQAGKPVSATYFHVTRVTISNIAKGKF